jgi:hypothetical protein
MPADHTPDADPRPPRSLSGATHAEPHRPGPHLQVTDQGATSPDPDPSTTDREPPSALGGGTGTRSNTAEGDYAGGAP